MDWRDQLSGLKAELPEGEESPVTPKAENAKKQQKEPLRIELDKRNGKPATLAKVARLGHDMRFDIPTVGPVTIETCAECGIRQIALEAGKTILLERDRVEELCKRHKISLHALQPVEQDTPSPENRPA